MTEHCQLMLLLQYFNQILTAVLEVLDDPDSSTRELSLALIVEMLNNQVMEVTDYSGLLQLFGYGSSCLFWFPPNFLNFIPVC